MKKILFIGTSHTYFNDMPETVAELYRMAGKEKPFVTMLTLAGALIDLGWQAWQPQNKFNITYGGYDQIVLQDVAHPFPGTEEFLYHIQRMMEEVIIPTGTETCLYMPWASRANDYPTQPEMFPAHYAAAEKYHTLLAPCGLGWELAQKELPEIDLYFDDGEQASPYGSFFNACVIYRALNYGEKPVFAEDGFYNERGLDSEKCRQLMELAGRLEIKRF